MKIYTIRQYDEKGRELTPPRQGQYVVYTDRQTADTVARTLQEEYNKSRTMKDWAIEVQECVVW